NYPITRLLDPSRSQHLTMGRSQLFFAAAEQISTAGERLCKKPLLLEHFAENDAQHFRVARVLHGIDPRAPAIDECLRVAKVLIENPARRLIRLPGGAAIRFGRIG